MNRRRGPCHVRALIWGVLERGVAVWSQHADTTFSFVPG